MVTSTPSYSARTAMMPTRPPTLALPSAATTSTTTVTEVNESCDAGLADTGRADTGIHRHVPSVDTGLPEEPDSPDPDDRTPPDATLDDEQAESAYTVSGEGCSCSVTDTPRRTGVWWLLTLS